MFDERHAIAALRGDPGYQALVKVLEDHLSALTEELAHEDDSDKALAALRVWQSARVMVHTLKFQPEAYADAIRREANESLQEHMFFGREEDPFSRRPPIPPPFISNK